MQSMQVTPRVQNHEARSNFSDSYPYSPIVVRLSGNGMHFCLRAGDVEDPSSETLYPSQDAYVRYESDGLESSGGTYVMEFAPHFAGTFMTNLAVSVMEELALEDSVGTIAVAVDHRFQNLRANLLKSDERLDVETSKWLANLSRLPTVLHKYEELLPGLNREEREIVKEYAAFAGLYYERYSSVVESVLGLSPEKLYLLMAHRCREMRAVLLDRAKEYARSKGGKFELGFSGVNPLNIGEVLAPGL